MNVIKDGLGAWGTVHRGGMERPSPTGSVEFLLEEDPSRVLGIIWNHEAGKDNDSDYACSQKELQSPTTECCGERVEEREDSGGEDKGYNGNDLIRNRSDMSDDKHTSSHFQKRTKLYRTVAMICSAGYMQRG